MKSTIIMKQVIEDVNVTFNFANETLRRATHIAEELSEILYDPYYLELVQRLVNGQNAMLFSSAYVLDFTPAGNARYNVSILEPNDRNGQNPPNEQMMPAMPRRVQKRRNTEHELIEVHAGSSRQQSAATSLSNLNATQTSRSVSSPGSHDTFKYELKQETPELRTACVNPFYMWNKKIVFGDGLKAAIPKLSAFTIAFNFEDGSDDNNFDDDFDDDVGRIADLSQLYASSASGSSSDFGDRAQDHNQLMMDVDSEDDASRIQDFNQLMESDESE